MIDNRLKRILWNKYVLCGLIDLAIAAAIVAYLWCVVFNFDAGIQVIPGVVS